MKKTISFICGALLAASLLACGGSQSSQQTTPAPAATDPNAQPPAGDGTAQPPAGDGNANPQPPAK